MQIYFGDVGSKSHSQQYGAPQLVNRKRSLTIIFAIHAQVTMIIPLVHVWGNQLLMEFVLAVVKSIFFPECLSITVRIADSVNSTGCLRG